MAFGVLCVDTIRRFAVLFCDAFYILAANSALPFYQPETPCNTASLQLGIAFPLTPMTLSFNVHCIAQVKVSSNLNGTFAQYVYTFLSVRHLKTMSVFLLGVSFIFEAIHTALMYLNFTYSLVRIFLIRFTISSDEMRL